MDEPSGPICGYCDGASALVSATQVYPNRRDLAERFVWRCTGCGEAWVGCHLPAAAGGIGDGTVPLGPLANAELRQWRTTVHTFLDNIWRKQIMSRSDAYAWLAEALGIQRQECHVAQFTLDQCKAAMQALAARDDPL